MRFRLFRSRAFWFGVPGLVFLLWGWGISKTHVTYLISGRRPNSVLLAQADGDVVLVWDYVRMLPRAQAEVSHEKAAPGETEDMKRLVKAMKMVGFSAWIVPHGWLVAGYSLGWAGLVAWRWNLWARARRSLLPEGPLS